MSINTIDQPVLCEARNRFYENDWLIVLATGVVFLFHCARFFNDEGWHVKNAVQSDVSGWFVIAVSQWIMPLFFLLSGMSSRYSLKSRGARTYLVDRTRRLMVPFLFSVFVVSIPLQVWIERVSHGDYAGSFQAFYPHYFDGFYAFGGNFAWMGLHLWYLLMLFLFSVLTLPLFSVFRNGLFAGLSRFTALPGGVFLFAVPLFGVELLVNLAPEGIGMRAFGGWSPLTYLLIFLMGYVLSSDTGYREGFRRNAYAALAVGVGTTALILLSVNRVVSVPGQHSYLVATGVRAVNSWAWLCALYGLGCRYMASDHRVLPVLREAALPFYIIHQTVIVYIGYLIADWSLPVAAKYVFLGTSSLAVILLLIGIVRRVRWLRPLFGMQ